MNAGLSRSPKDSLILRNVVAYLLVKPNRRRKQCDTIDRIRLPCDATLVDFPQFPLGESCLQTYRECDIIASIESCVTTSRTLFGG